MFSNWLNQIPVPTIFRGFFESRASSFSFRIENTSSCGMFYSLWNADTRPVSFKEIPLVTLKEFWRKPSNYKEWFIPIIFWYTYTQSCLSSLLRINLSRNSSQHCTAVWNIVSLQLRAPIRNEFTEILSAVRLPQWYNNDCTSRRTSSLNGESDVPVRQVSMVDDKQNSNLVYSCLC